jgi:hypothetical protein
VKAGFAKHTKSKARRTKDKEFFKHKDDKRTQETIKRTLQNMRERDRLARRAFGAEEAERKLLEEKEELEGRLEETQEELEETKRELTRQNRAFAALGRKAKKERNDALNIARNIYMDKERGLKEQYEQQISELVAEVEVQEEGRWVAEDKVKQLERDMEDTYIDLFGENLFY